MERVIGVVGVFCGVGVERDVRMTLLQRIHEPAKIQTKVEGRWKAFERIRQSDRREKKKEKNTSCKADQSDEGVKKVKSDGNNPSK